MSLSSLYERSLRKLVFAITAFLFCNGLISLGNAQSNMPEAGKDTIRPA